MKPAWVGAETSSAEIRSRETKRDSFGLQHRSSPSQRAWRNSANSSRSSIVPKRSAIARRSAVARARIAVICTSATLNGAAAHCRAGSQPQSRYTSTRWMKRW